MNAWLTEPSGEIALASPNQIGPSSVYIRHLVKRYERCEP